MESFNYVGEIVVGIVLLAFAGAFSRWSGTLKDSFLKIMTKLDKLSEEFHEHSIRTERRVTRIETKVDVITNGKTLESATRDDHKRP